jgi:imidazoleglycerol phosphate synthase glutamine amidotransferase subunit HisH
MYLMYTPPTKAGSFQSQAVPVRKIGWNWVAQAQWIVFPGGYNVTGGVNYTPSVPTQFHPEWQEKYP